MPASTTVMGMVLSAMPVGDYDKRLVILTREIGKISAFAKGARRPNSALLACSEPFSFGEFTLYVGRNSYSVQSAQISNYFSELRADFEGLLYGMYFCEFAEYITKENNDEREILKLLYQTLRALVKKTIELPLVRAIYELKLIAINGEAPQVFHCVKCEGRSGLQGHEAANHYHFSPESGGILCISCKNNDPNAIPIDTSTLYAMQYIIATEIEKLYTFKVSSKVLRELTRCIKNHLQCYVNYEFKSLQMLQLYHRGIF